ncbi:unnamed protein product [Adineta ricciae]|uniref:Uncharacterized protein n=1 Tax=Adineta ricciae TaxID=249248 RepID=A0A816HFJ5_ADIRI|nr:unnamed protein product [Adineta ricciae]
MQQQHLLHLQLQLVTPTTVGPTTSGSTTESTVTVMYPKDLEVTCSQALALMTPLMYVILAPSYAVVLYAAFVKFANMFNPANINAKERHKLRLQRILEPREAFELLRHH